MKGVIDINPSFLRRHPLPAPGVHTDKNRRGRAMMVGGGESAPGSILLAAIAALHAGAGKVQVGAPASVTSSLGFLAPELGIIKFSRTPAGEPSARSRIPLATLLSQSDAALVGPGLSEASNAWQLARRMLRTARCPLVFDAAAIAGLWPHAQLMQGYQSDLIITPHHGEMATLTGHTERTIAANPQRAATQAARHLNCTVILKSVDTLIVTAHGETFIHRSGVSGLATAGSGDVLAGILTGLLARGATPLTASAWAVHLHAAAGKHLSASVGPVGFLAREISSLVPTLMAR